MRSICKGTQIERMHDLLLSIRFSMPRNCRWKRSRCFLWHFTAALMSRRDLCSAIYLVTPIPVLQLYASDDRAEIRHIRYVDLKRRKQSSRACRGALSILPKRRYRINQDFTQQSSSPSFPSLRIPQATILKASWTDRLQPSIIQESSNARFVSPSIRHSVFLFLL